jgi:hypothetical protein
MSAPAFVVEVGTPYNATSPKTTAPVNIVVGDMIVVYAVTADESATVTLTNSGLALAWTQEQVINITDFCWVSIWTHRVTQTRSSVTFTLTRVGITTVFAGGTALVFRGSNGVGASAQTTNASGAPALDLAVGQHSAVVAVVGDWARVDGAARVWRTNAGTLTQVTYSRDATQLTVYAGYHPNAGEADTYTLGLSAPGGQKYAIAAVELLGQEPSLTYVAQPVYMRS